MGTPNFSVGILERLLTSVHELLAVVTNPDKAAGRGLKIVSSEVKKFASTLDVPILQPNNLKDEEFIQQLKALKPDLIFVVAFKYLPKAVWEIPKLGTVNLHTSLLPDYKGAAPINWAIINGETETGVTTFLINESIDSGAILFNEKIKILAEDNAGSLHDKMIEVGKELSVFTLDSLANGEYNPKIQIENSTKSAPKIFSEDCEIFWNLPSVKVNDKIRGLNPYPGAYTFLLKNGEKIKLKILKSTWQKHLEAMDVSKTTLEKSKTGLKVVFPDGEITLDEIQPEGKKKMSSKDFVNGLQKTDVLELLPF